MAMTLSRFLAPRDCSPTTLVLLLIAALIGGGLEIRPTPADGCSIASDDRAPDPPPRDESADESAEDGEEESAKHSALGSTIPLATPAPRAGLLRDRPARTMAGERLGGDPIRGPPAQA